MTSATLTHEDPYYWSIDQLVYELCGNPEPVWASIAKKTAMPPVDAFQKAIEDNVLDGESFMSMEMVDIATELGFSAFGTKRNIYKIIRFLRSISAEYRRQNLVDHVMPYINGVESPQITGSHLSARPQSVAYGNQTPGHPLNSPRLSNALASTPAQWPVWDQRNATPQPAVDPTLQIPMVPSIEHQNVVDRRTPKVHVGGLSTKLQAEEASTPLNEHPVAPPLVQPQIKEKKRVAPTLVPQIAQDPENHYLDPSRQGLEESLFLQGGDSEHEFVLGETRKSLGQRIGIATAVKSRLLMSSTLTRPIRDNSRRILPRIRKDVIPKDDLLTSIGLAKNPFSVPEQAEQVGTIADLSDGYLRLLEDYPPVSDDEEYTELGEGEYDDKTWAEIQAEIEENEHAASRTGLTKAEINTAIDQAIEEMTLEWQQSELPKIQRKGYRLWRRAARWRKVAREEDGDYFIGKSDYWLARLEASILKLRTAISDDTWHEVAKVKGQCRSLESSVFQREEHKYYLSILHSNKQPPRPDKSTLFRATKADQTGLPEGEEILESESESSTSSSDDSFIEHDNSETGSIPYENSASHTRPRDLEVNSESGFTAFESSDLGDEGVSIPDVASPASGDDEPVLSDQDTGSDDSDDQIRGSARRRPRESQSSPQVAAVTPSRKQQLSQSILDTSYDSDSEMDSDLDAPAPLPPSQWRKKGTKDKPIELMSSPSAPGFSEREVSMGSIRTPDLNPASESPQPRNKHVPPKSSVPSASISDSSSSQRLNFVSSTDDGPSVEDVNAIRGMQWDDIEFQRDYRRALAKAVYGLEVNLATKLQSYLDKIAAHVERIVKNVLLAYGQEDANIEEIAVRDQDVARCLGLLFLTYNTAMSCMDEPELGQDVLDEVFLRFESVDFSLRRFCALLRIVLKAHCSFASLKKRGKKRKSDESALDDLDDYDLRTDDDKENPTDLAARSAKKRKKKVLQSQEAESQQVDDQARLAQDKLVRALMQEKLNGMEDNADGDMNQSAMHLVSYNLDAPIYLDPHIGQKVKPHQENGIQFMWREITAGKGCMLAHTMGLGKTMQVISLLVTIAQASQSEDISVRDQVPEELRESRTLILCPPTLIDNWYEEIMMWTPKGSHVLGQVRKVVSATKAADRLSIIKAWARGGGVLLMSYELFRTIVDLKSPSLPDHLKQVFADRLTQGPSIVVADEAHHIKNPTSAIAKATKLFKTKSRIALTGSPLSNHLEEYHQMVDWVAPGYLGSLVQFKAKYSEPIKEGLYSDSTSYERRLSARKLLVLKRDLEPKICRADISAIAKDMPNKAEFFITVPLTHVQKDAYSKYARYMLQQHGTGSNARLWAWLSVLVLLLNHPSAFVQKLKQRDTPEPTTRQVERESSIDTDDLALPEDVPVSTIGLSSEAVDDILNAFTTMTPEVQDDMQHSYRSLLTSHIVKESMRIHEKVLIFSHSIPTLDYLERMLKGLDCNYIRIDGSTSMPSRQTIVKDFNEQPVVQVMLISTQAGGLGLNLQGANRVIIYDFNFNPTWEEQAIGRAYRLGQQKHVFVYRFRAGGTFEETIYNMSIFKTQLFARVVDKRNPMRFATKKLSDYLFPPREVEQTSLEECQGKDPQVLDLIMAKEACIRKVELTETFQVEEDDGLTPEELKQAEQEYQDEVLARTDPGKLARLQDERSRRARMAQVQHMAGQQQQSFSPRTMAPPQPTGSARNTSPAYPLMPVDMRAASLSYDGNGVGVPRSSTAHDDTNIERPVRHRSSSISQMDGSKDEHISGCGPQ